MQKQHNRKWYLSNYTVVCSKNSSARNNIVFVSKDLSEGERLKILRINISETRSQLLKRPKTRAHANEYANK